MSVYLDLLPPPQFDRSLVAYTVGNFQRIKDAFLRVSNRIYTYSVGSTGGLPLSWTITTPFRSDVLVHYTFSGWVSTPSITGVNTYLDGAPFGYSTMFNTFSIANAHLFFGGTPPVLRSQAPGAHVWRLENGGGLNTDGNDRFYIHFVFVEV